MFSQLAGEGSYEGKIATKTEYYFMNHDWQRSLIYVDMSFLQFQVQSYGMI